MRFLQLIVALILITFENCVSSIDFNTREEPIVINLRRTLFSFYQGLQTKDKNKQQKMQNVYPQTFPFFCDSTMKRSPVKPKSINQLRPGDIDIVAAMGDSLTGGNGIIATHLLDIGFENRGLAFSIGGEGTWRNFITLPNILKEYNPNLYGYSTKTTLSTNRESRFNVAENAAASSDMIYQAKVLKQRFENDRNVNMTNDWKMVTLFFGGIDFCHLACNEPNSSVTLKKHEHDMLKTLRYLRDNIPRIIVNILAAPNILLLTNQKRPNVCDALQTFLCPCFSQFKSKKFKERGGKIIRGWHELDDEVTNRDEFHTEEFTVNIMNYINNVNFKYLPNGNLDLRYFSVDCFHFSQRLHAIAAIALWNNLLQPYGQRSNYTDLTKPLKLKCPTEKCPYFRTKLNS